MQKTVVQNAVQFVARDHRVPGNPKPAGRIVIASHAVLLRHGAAISKGSPTQLEITARCQTRASLVMTSKNLNPVARDHRVPGAGEGRTHDPGMR
ncbi:MAG: hypothetical protein V2A56_05025 [bacterium]